MPYLEISRNLDRHAGQDNGMLFDLAKLTIARSPELPKDVILHDEIMECKDKEAVGIGFNRYVMTTLNKRWDELEEKQNLLKEDMIGLHGALNENKVRMQNSWKESAKDRIQNLVLGSRIGQLEGHCFNLQGYLNTVKELIHYYKPAKLFMKDLAERMNFQNEMQIINRHRTLTLIKKEMTDDQMSSVEAVEAQKLILKNVKEDNLQVQLKISYEMNELSEKYKIMEKSNNDLESELYSAMSQASETARATFRTSTGIRRIYDTILSHKNQESTTFDPFEMLLMIERRFKHLKDVVDEIIRVQRHQTLSPSPSRLVGIKSSKERTYKKMKSPFKGKSSPFKSSPFSSKIASPFSTNIASPFERVEDMWKSLEYQQAKANRPQWKKAANKAIGKKSKENLLKEQKNNIGKENVNRKVTINLENNPTKQTVSQESTPSTHSLDANTNTNQSNRNCLSQILPSSKCLPPIKTSENRDECENQRTEKAHVLHLNTGSRIHYKIPLIDSTSKLKVACRKGNCSSDDSRQNSSLNFDSDVRTHQISGRKINRLYHSDSSPLRSAPLIDKKPKPSIGSPQRARSQINKKPNPSNGSPNKVRSHIKRKAIPPISSPNKTRLHVNRKPNPSIGSPVQARPHNNRKVNPYFSTPKR